MKNKLLISVVSLLGFSSLAIEATAAEFPPPPQNHTSVTINNQTADSVTWQYQETFGTATSSPGNGTISAGGQGSAEDTINFNSGGLYWFNINGVQLSAGVGYGPCRGSEVVGNYQVTAGGSVSSCTITLSNISQKQ